MNIGAEIKKVATSLGLSQTAVAERIGDKQQNVGNDYKKSSLTFERLLLYSEALDHNFFQYYNNAEPYKSFREVEHSEFRNEIDQLTKKLDQIHQLLAAHEKTIQTQNELIKTQRALIENLQKRQ